MLFTIMFYKYETPCQLLPVFFRMSYLIGFQNMPKNKLIEAALSLYLDHLKRAEYIKSYRQADHDSDMIMLAE